MRAAWFAVLLVGPLLAPGGLGQAEPALVADQEPIRFNPTTFRVLAAPVGANLLQNPSLDEGFSAPWRFTTTEVGTGGSILVDQNALYFGASNVGKNGTLHAMQSVEKPDGGTMHFSYRAASIGRDAMPAAFILRERTLDGRALDTTFAHPLTPTMRAYEWTWQPKVPEQGSVQVFVRLRATIGLQQEARVDDIGLRPGPEVAWSVESGRVQSSGGLAATVVFDQLGTHRVSAEATRLGQAEWQAETVVTVAAAPPVANLRVSPPTPPLGQPFLLHAGGTSDPDGILRLSDPTFEQGQASWPATAQETGGALVTSRQVDALGRPILDLAVSGATRDGSVHASHVIPVARLEAAAFTVGIRDDGRIQRYEFILREANATGATTDSKYSFAPTNGEERLASMVWEPKRTDTVSLRVYLRYLVLQGSSAQVSFIQPTLQSGLTYSYYLDDRFLGSTWNATWPIALPDLEEHVALVEVRDPDGAVSNATLTLKANDAGYLWRVRAPAVAPLAPAPLLDASGTRRQAGAEILRNGDFAQGKQDWSLGSGETGGLVSWEVLQDQGGSFARLRIEGERPGSNYLLQAVDLRCLDVPCVFSFSARLVEGDAQLEPILRATVQPPGQAARNVDLRYSPVLGPQWSYNETAWNPPTEDVVRLQAFLRIRTPANGSAVVDFRGVRLGPERVSGWQLEGPSGAQSYEGPVIQPTLTTPGRHSAEIQLETTYGPGASFKGSYAMEFDVLPVSFFRTQEGVGIQVSGERDNASVSLVKPDGGVDWRRAVTTQAGQGLLETRNVLGAFVLASVQPGDRLVLDNGTAQGTFEVDELLRTLPDPVGALNVSTRHGGWTSHLRVQATVSDPSLTNVTITIRGGGKVLDQERVPLGSQGIEATLDLPTAWSDRNGVVTIETEDVWGRKFTHSSRFESSDNPILLPSAIALAVALILVVGGVLSRVLNRRGGL